jgi:hypothetical protein
MPLILILLQDGITFSGTKRRPMKISCIECKPSYWIKLLSELGTMAKASTETIREDQSSFLKVVEEARKKVGEKN